MFLITLKIWGTCIVLTMASWLIYDFPKKPGSLFDVMVTTVCAAFVVVDIILFFVLVLMGIWV